MSYKISKELFEAVMETSVYKVYTEKNIIESTNWDYEHDTEWHNDNISINDFFFECKEWAYNKGYIIKTDIAGEWELYNFKNGGIFDTQNSSSEQQSVFDACQWILDNKDKQ